jgi:hypothetical protein
MYRDTKSNRKLDENLVLKYEGASVLGLWELLAAASDFVVLRQTERDNSCVCETVGRRFSDG